MEIAALLGFTLWCAAPALDGSGKLDGESLEEETP